MRQSQRSARVLTLARPRESRRGSLLHSLSLSLSLSFSRVAARSLRARLYPRKIINHILLVQRNLLHRFFDYQLYGPFMKQFSLPKSNKLNLLMEISLRGALSR